MKFLGYTRELNKLAISLQKINETILEEDIIKAIFYLNNIYINDTGDCLIFLASLNLCNAYIKQNKDKISYAFKKGVEYIISILNYREIKDIYINCSKDNGKLYLFQIGDMQFSFHDEKKIEINEKYIKELSWDGVRKQKCAKAIFDSVVSNKIRVTNMTYRGKNLNDKLEKTLDNYREKKIEFKELTRFQL